MIEKIRQYFFYIKKQRENYYVDSVIDPVLYWIIFSVIIICFSVGILFLFYENYVFSILASFIGLLNIAYLKYFNKSKFTGDLLILLVFIIFSIGAFLSNGILSPAMPVLIVMPISANYIGYYVKAIEATCISIVISLSLFLVSKFGLIANLLENTLELNLMFYFVILCISALYIALNDYNKNSIEHKQRKLDQLKSEWVSVVSHELRTPLTAIRGAMGLVNGGLAGEVSPQAKELIKIANKNCERLTRLVNDILDIEKMEKGLVSLNLKPTDLNPVIQDAVSTYLAQASENYIDLIVELDSSAIILADRDRITQVVQNLISNALKFSPAQSKIIIKTVKKEFCVRVDVVDFGMGIPKEFQPQIFQKFTQADSSSSRQAQGSGLGLAICRSLIALHDGTIGFEPNNSSGANFWFEIPLYRKS
jgi:signal transduction histidine kinase